MPNGNLSRWIGPCAAVQLTLQQRIDVLIGVAQAVQYLHLFPLVHAHIHPANVLLDSCMRAKLTDFGLIRDRHPSSAISDRVSDSGTRDDGVGNGAKAGATRDGRRGTGAGVQAGRQDAERRDGRGAGKVEERGHGGRERQGSNKDSGACAGGGGGSSGSGGGGGGGGGGDVCSAGGDMDTASHVSGYMDPEFLHTHQLLPAVDVYSVGVLALMLLTARTATTAATHQHSDNHHQGVHIHGTGDDRRLDRRVNGHADSHTDLKSEHADERATLIHWVASLVPTQNPATFTDPYLLSPSSSTPPPNPRSLLRLATLALSCTALPSSSRPSVNRLLLELTEIREELFGAARSATLERVDREVADMQGGDFLAEMARAESLASGASVSGGMSGGMMSGGVSGGTGASWAVTSVSGGAGVSGAVSGGVNGVSRCERYGWAAGGGVR
ncbi:unnamed protein product [Closterium sp. Yama58-4]|nr:unnamed protein product [Closterium sp. Yama58-4]